ncbi:hypothetical protein F4780DRAFT_774600 [Xylariomycetidae sp. FL0641]|nr:hypothetical protein F4780DRAFT_774600 [Xylariomycetidae sp. FL0641]
MPSFGFNTEFEFLDFHENQHTAPGGFFGLGGDDFSDAQGFGDPKTILTGSAKPPRYSSTSHRGSSSSSSRSNESASPNTSHSSADAMLVDDSFAQWSKPEPSTMTHNPDFMQYGSIDHSAIDLSHFIDLDSAPNSPSPPTTCGQSPDTPMVGNVIPQAPAAKRLKNHHKAQSQKPLNHITRVKKSGSRDMSPASNLAISHDTSPTAAFLPSPSPDVPVNYFNGPMALNMTSSWPSMRPLPPNGVLSQGRPVVAHASKQHHGLPAAPAQNPHASSSADKDKLPKLVIHPTPPKSRVETQIPIKLTIHSLPPQFKRVHLPTHTISKPKLLAKPHHGRAPDMLEVHTMLVCSSAMADPEKRERAYRLAAAARHDYSQRSRPRDEDDGIKPQDGGEVRICTGCITRERKRAGRKKHKKPEEEELWNKFEHDRVIVFNTQEVKEWTPVTQDMADPTGTGQNGPVPEGTVQVDAPMRIACYCRHHSEKVGFNVIFTVKDYKDNIVAQKMSDNIMITDDHKTHLPTTSTLQTNGGTTTVGLPQATTPVDAQPMDLHMPAPQTRMQSPSEIQNMGPNQTFAFPSGPPAHVSLGNSASVTPRNVSRQGSPAHASGPLGRKRKASGSGPKVPNGLMMTSLQENQPAMTSNARTDSAGGSASTSPFTPNLNSFPLGAEGLFAQSQQQQALNTLQQPFATGPPTPGSNGVPEPFTFNASTRAMSLDNLPTNQLFSAPASAHPSRAPSPNHLRNEIQNLQHGQLTQGLFTAPLNVVSTRPQPKILRIIPAEGPKSGGVEVTLLGSGFTNDGLEVYFGNHKATTTTYWGESSLVSLLPPSPTAGIVLVTIKQRGGSAPLNCGQQPQVFRYIDDDEERLIRTALAVLGNKLGGDMADVAEIARNIIYGAGNGGSWGPSGSGSGGQAPGNSFNSLGLESKESVEKSLLRILEFIDIDDSDRKARIDLRRKTGQTMLHLACSLGFLRLTVGLIMRGATVGLRDKSGFTALHMAAMNNHPEIVRRLLQSGADPNVRTLSGLTAFDVTHSNDVMQELQDMDNHARSRSCGSRHSRANSASSLRSLWDRPPAAQARGAEYRSNCTTPDIYRDSDSLEGAESEGADPQFLDMRRPQFPGTATRPPFEWPAGAASPSAAMMALRDQVSTQLQQFQHSMALHLQNFPQLQMPNMPQMPQMPQMPMFPDYQAYLHSAPVMQRISSLVPTIRSPRSESGEDEAEPPRDTDQKWWDRSFFGAKEVPPPAYEEIFPHKNLDTKQASAAQAAADAEADEKCAALYDQDTAESTVESRAGSSRSQEVPAMLRIGRKHHITKEQQENLQRAHAQRLKAGSSDRMLWFVWIPILVFVLGAMLFSGAPSLAAGTVSAAKSFSAFVANPRGLGEQLSRVLLI